MNKDERKSFEAFMFGERGCELHSMINCSDISANAFAWEVWQAARYTIDAELVDALEKVAFMGLDAFPGADLEHFYRSQLCACISIAANALAKHKGKD